MNQKIHIFNMNEGIITACIRSLNFVWPMKKKTSHEILVGGSQQM